MENSKGKIIPEGPCSKKSLKSPFFSHWIKITMTIVKPTVNERQK